MAGNVGIIWNTPMMFTRLVEDCGFIAELITPHLLAAPHFRRKYSVVIIPGGFAHPDYSQVLPALRACDSRILRFVRSGGTILVFGGGIDCPDAYGWLPFTICYRFGFSEGVVCGDAGTLLSCITDDCPETVSFDGTFEIPAGNTGKVPGASVEGDEAEPYIHLSIGGLPVLIEYRAGAGRIIVTSIHEYPSKRFLQSLCSDISETLL